MISKNLYFNLLREDMKRRIWTLALAMLAFVIALPIYAMLSLDRLISIIEDVGIEQARLDYANIGTNSEIGLLFVITIIGAFLCALSGFSYLYSKSKVDLFHSIPVKREKIFLATFINGIIIYVVPYFVNIILYFMIGGSQGLLTKEAVSGALLTLSVNILGYLFIYNITIIAVMMTGKLIVGVLGTTIFMIYGPAVLLVRAAISGVFLKTYYESILLQDQLVYVSPISAYYQLYSLMGKNGFGSWFVGIFLVTLVAIAISIFLYKIRPSESAGKSMAFHETQFFIKFLIAVPTALVGGLLFISMSYTSAFSWMLFGIIFIGFLAHGIIEIIYNSDFKCIIKNKIHLVICIGLSIVIAGAIKVDLFKYDEYIPNENKIASMSVSFNNLEPMDNYYDLTKEYYDNSEYNTYYYVSSDTYRLDHTNLTNYDAAYQLVQYAIANNYSETDYASEENSDIYTTFSVKYTLENKTKKYRYYTVKLNDIMNYLEVICADESYKEGVYQIFTMDPNIINSINYYNSTEDIENTLKLSEEQKQEFLEVYTKDLKTLTATQMVSSIPVAQLILVIGEDTNYVTQPYYVYPQFTQTIAYMKSLGANLDVGFDLDNIEKVTIIDYSAETDGEYDVSDMQQFEDSKLAEMYYGDQAQMYEFTDKGDIEAICNAITPSRFNNGAKIGTNISNYLDISISYTNSENTAGIFSLIGDKLPTNIQQQIGY